MLVQRVRVVDDARVAALDFAGGSDIDLDMLLDSPFALFGTESHIASRLERLRTEHGVSYVTTFEHSAEPSLPLPLACRGNSARSARRREAMTNGNR